MEYMCEQENILVYGSCTELGKGQMRTASFSLPANHPKDTMGTCIDDGCHRECSRVVRVQRSMIGVTGSLYESAVIVSPQAS